MTIRINTEYSDQCTLVEYLEYLKTQGKIVLFTVIPNNTFTPGWGAKVRNKKMGLRPGFPDLVILTKNNYFIALELKRKEGTKSDVSLVQQAWIRELAKVKGVYSCVAYGYEQAKELIDEYLKI